MSEEYNGWTNHSTWLVHLWITNEEGSYHHWREQAAEMDPDTLALALREAHEEEADEVPQGWRKDAVLGVVSEVNWREIAEHFTEEETP